MPYRMSSRGERTIFRGKIRARTLRGKGVRMPGGSPSDVRSYMGTSIPTGAKGYLNKHG
jgi:hypothetical protein